MNTSSPPKNDRPEGVSAPEARSPMRDRQTVATAGQPLPTPRIQFRYERIADKVPGWTEYMCHYELVIPLRELDIRREDDQRTEFAISVSKTKVTTGATPCIYEGNLVYHAPFRDGAHADWDMEALGITLPVFCIAPDGRAVERPAKATGTQS